MPLAMSSTNVGSEQAGSTETPLSIQDIIKKISKLHERLAKNAEAEVEVEAEADSPQKITVGTNISANNQIGNEQDGSNSRDVSQGIRDDTNKQDADVRQDSNKQVGDVSQVNQEGVAQEIKNTESNKKGKDDRQEKIDESNKRKEVLHELGKLSKELQYMISSFKKLENFETNLREPLNTLEANVDDILKDLVKVGELPNQVPLNLRVLRNNITRVKIQIPLQHQTANSNSEANRALQTTVATREAEDLPHLYNEDIFENSYYSTEIAEKYEELDIRQKLCLLCFAIFPENAEIKKRLLRFWWVGENLIAAKDTEEEKELVSQTLQIFVEKGFIEPVQKKNKLQPRSYKMNPIVLSCLISFAQKARFFQYDSEGKPTMDFRYCKKACMVKSEGAPVSWFSRYFNEPGTGRLPADLVKLQMLFNFPEEKLSEEKLSEKLSDAKRRFRELQTLFNISKQFPALPMEWFSMMTDISVLYLGRWESSAGRQRHIEVEDIDFLKGLKNMKKLRLLSLQGISGIPKLPSNICKLENLRFLDLRACHDLEKLPHSIGSLKKLTYLDLSECYLLDDMPKQLNQLWELQVLKGFVIGDGKNSCMLEDLSELKILRKLSVNVNTIKFDIDNEEKALSKFQKLQKLKIAWGSGGFTGNNSTQDGGEGKKQEKDSLKWKTKNQDENKKSHGSSKSVALKVSEQDNRKQGTGSKRLRSVTNAVLFAKKLSIIRREKKPKNPEGLENLVKLDLQCFPCSTPPKWLVPQTMIRLRNLCIRGGRLSHLIQEDKMKWRVETLRLKFLMDFKMDWKDMRERFPNLTYLENVRCPRITFCPCDANGVWQNSSK